MGDEWSAQHPRWVSWQTGRGSPGLQLPQIQSPKSSVRFPVLPFLTHSLYFYEPKQPENTLLQPDLSCVSPSVVSGTLGKLGLRVSLPTSRKSIFPPSSYTNMPPAACHWAWVRGVLPWSLCSQGCILQIVKLRDNFFFPLKFCKKDFWKSDNKISEQRL